MEVDLLQRPCVCGNLDGTKYRCYYGNNGELLGILCESCGKEWLQERFLQNDMQMFIFYKSKKLFYRVKAPATVTVLPDVSTSQVQAGCHIKWSEGLGSESLNVDAIVETSDESCTLVPVITLQKLSFCEVTVGRMFVDLSKINVQVVDYKMEVNDPPELVCARAVAWCKAEDICNLFTTKGNVFASYCKCGPGRKWRAMWLGGAQITTLLRTLVGPSWISGHEEHCQSVVEHGHTKRKIKTGLLFAMDGSAIAFELHDRMMEISGVVQAEIFIDSIIKRFIDIVTDNGMKVGGAVAGGATGGGIGSLVIPSIDVTDLSFFIGSVIKGSVVKIPKKLVGSSLGRAFGHAIHMSVKRGDEEIPISKLKKGDQVVLPGHVGHPRCHAIVVSVNANTSKLKLIRNTYGRGVVEEWVETPPVVLRVKDVDVTQSGDEVISRARSKLGETHYNLLTYNCKHFATWCKRH